MYTIQEEEIKQLIGGSLIFGITDKTNEVVGLTDVEGDSEKISRFLRDRMDPFPAFVLRLATVDAKKLIIMVIECKLKYQRLI